jgi:hypothetical protein
MADKSGSYEFFETLGIIFVDVWKKFSYGKMLIRLSPS